MIGEAFAADLLRAAAFTRRVDQLNPVGVDDPEDGRRGEEGLRPVMMRLKEAKEPGPLPGGGGTVLDNHASTSEKRHDCPPL